jgi:hypothetical protein
MPMRLAGATVVSRVEESKQSPLLAVVLPCPQARIRRLQIILLENVRLLLIRLRGKDEVSSDDGKFVEDQQMTWARSGDVDNVEVGRGVVKRIEVLLGRVLVQLWNWLFRKRWAVSELELLLSTTYTIMWFGKHVYTGIPDEVRMMASSVGENSRLEDALAAANLASTRLGSASERLSSILMGSRRYVDWWLRDVRA